MCAQGCLRGVVLSAAEMGLQRRFSTITVTEEHLRDGQLESTIIEGVSHILERLQSAHPQSSFIRVAYIISLAQTSVGPSGKLSVCVCVCVCVCGVVVVHA